MTPKTTLYHSEDISQVHGRVVCPEAALRLLARLIARDLIGRKLGYPNAGVSVEATEKHGPAKNIRSFIDAEVSRGDQGE